MKQKTGRKLLSILLTLAMVIGLMPGMSLTAYAETSTWTSGDCTVTYDTETNTVTVKKTSASSATGNMADYGVDSYGSVPVSPWNDIKGNFQQIVIEEGVTGIGNYAFINCDSIKNITIPVSVTNIGESAFYTSEPGRRVIFIRPESESSLTVANGAFYYSATLAYSDGGNYSLFAGDNEIELSGTYNGDKLNGKTLIWKLPIFSITDNSVNGSVTASVRDSDVTKAEVGDTVTLTVKPASGYKFKSIKATLPKEKVEEFSDLVSLMGNAVFAGDSGYYNFSGYTCKVDGNKFVVYNGTTLVAETTNITDFTTNEYGATFSCGDINWGFSYSDGKIDRIYLYDSSYDSLFDSAYPSESNGALQPVEFELTTVVAGSKYSFTMPKKSVTVKAEFEESTHEHSFTYSTDGTTVTATCANSDGNCTLAQNKVAMTISAEGTTYDNNTHGANLESAAWTAAGLTVPTIQYAGRNSTTYNSETAPTNAGDYTASVTVDTNKTAKVNYTISKAESTANAPTGLTATYGQTLADVELTNPTGNTIGEWTWVDDSTDVGTVGEHKFKANFMPTDTANYNAKNNVDVTVTVGKAANPATVTNTATVTKGGNTVDLSGNVTLNKATGDVSYAISGNANGCTLSGSVLTSGNNAGSVTVNVTVAEDGNYNALAATPITVMISDKGMQTITAENVIANYGDTDKSISATTDGNGTISYAVKEGSGDYIDINATTGALTIKKVGTATVIVTAAETATYEQATKEVTVTISKAAPTVTAPTAKTLTYNGQKQELVNAGSATGGTLYYAVTTENAAPTDENLYTTFIPTATDAGTYYVWYKVVGDANHNDLAATPVTAEIAKAAITITADDKSTQYGADIAELTYKVSGAYVQGDDLDISINTTATNTSYVGPYDITLNWNNNANYNATLTNGKYMITRANLTVSASGYSGTYDGQAHGISVGVGDSDAIVYYGITELNNQNYNTAGSTTNPTYTNAGTYTVYYYVKSTNYEPHPLSSHQTVTIAKANVEVTAPSAANLTYNGSDRALISGGSVTGGSFAYILGENATNAPTGDTAWSTNVPTGKNAGTYYVWYKGVGDGNYNDSAPACITVTIGKKAATISANAASKTYGDADPTLTANVNGAVGTEVLQYTLSRAAGENVNNYAITVTVEATANPNYDITVNGNTFTINKKALTITADSATKVYDTTALTKNSYTNTDLATGDSIESVTIIGSQTTAASSANVPSGAVIKKGETDVTANYEITYENGTLTVTKATTNIVTVDITGWTYGSAANAPTSNANFGADTVVYTYSDKADGAYTATVPMHAGTYYVKAFVAGTDNYVEGSAVKGFTIAKKAATVTADAKSKTYGEEDPALTYMATGLLGSDSLIGTLARAEGETVGTYAITQGTVESNDYDITYVGANLTVNTRAVVVSNILAKDKKHDGNTEATLDYSYVNFENIVAADAGKLTVSAVGTFDDAQIGNDKNVTITGLTLGGEVAANYVLAAQGQQTNATADISNMASTDSTDGHFRTEVKDFQGFKPQVTGLDLELAKSLCTPAELAAYEAGGKLEMELEVGLAGAAMTGDVVELVTNAVKDQKQAKLDGAQYLDITLYKVVNGVRTKVTNLNGKTITIKLSVPGDMENKVWENRRTFYAVRVHSGVATVLAETTSMEIPFSTDLFSVYAIAYADVQVITYDTTKTTATGNNTVTTAVVAPKTDGTDETARTILVFGTAFAMAAIAINVYVFRRRKEEE